jgi:hypothetical protein
MGERERKEGGLRATFGALWDAFDAVAPWGPALRAVLAVAALVLVLVLLGIVVVKQLAAPGPVERKGAETGEAGRRTLPSSKRSEVVTALRSLSPQRFSIARTAADTDSVDLADAILAELLQAHWKNDSGVGILLPDGARGVTIRMKKTTEPAIYLLKSLNMAGIQAQAFADVPEQKTYDVEIVVGPAP